jgi:predicted nucleotidyltransferase
MEPATEKILARITEIIVKEIDPQQIILFGSQSRDTPHPDSDFDFLIVQDRPFGPAQTRRQEMSRLWRLLAHFPISQDILIFTPEELEDWRQSTNHVIARALREGKILYERH